MCNVFRFLHREEFEVEVDSTFGSASVSSSLTADVLPSSNEATEEQSSPRSNLNDISRLVSSRSRMATSMQARGISHTSSSRRCGNKPAKCCIGLSRSKELLEQDELSKLVPVSTLLDERTRCRVNLKCSRNRSKLVTLCRSFPVNRDACSDSDLSATSTSCFHNKLTMIRY